MQTLTWQELSTMQAETNESAYRAAIAKHAEFIPAYRVMSLEPKRQYMNGAMYVVPGATEWIEWGSRTFYDRQIAEEQARYDEAHGKTVKIVETKVTINYHD